MADVVREHGPRESDSGLGRQVEYSYDLANRPSGWLAEVRATYMQADDTSWSATWVSVQFPHHLSGQEEMGRVLARKLAAWAAAGRLADLPLPE